MFLSISFYELTDAQRQTFTELGIGPGDRVYVKKLRPLSNQALAAAHAQHVERGLTHPRAAYALATEFERHPKTITRHLGGFLRIHAPVDRSPKAAVGRSSFDGESGRARP